MGARRRWSAIASAVLAASVALALVGCSAPETVRAAGEELPPPPEPRMANERGHADFRRAFTDGEQFVDEDGSVLTTEVRRLGDVELTSGELMISDPSYLTGDVAEWYEHPVPGRAPVGTWPVEVALAHWSSDPADESDVYEIAAMRMRFADRPAATWEPTDLSSDGELVPRGVDAGTMMIADMDALRAAGDELEPTLWSDLEASADWSEQFTIRPLPGGGSYAISQSGAGDGAYCAWWGFDEAGDVVEVVIDYDVLIRNTWTEIDVPIDVARRPGPIASPEIDAAGLELESVSPSEAAARWNQQQSPYDTRATYDADEIFLALRSSGRWIDTELRDSSGVRVELSGPQIGPGGENDEKLEYWLEADGSDRVTTVHLQIFDGVAPLSPP